MDERTHEILKRFQQSWVDTEKLYVDLTDSYTGFERLFAIRRFLLDLKKNSGEQYFRLGTSIHRLLISRSVAHGLRPDQKYIKIDAFDHKFEVTLKDGHQIYRQYMIDDLSDERLNRLLKTLKQVLVD